MNPFACIANRDSTVSARCGWNPEVPDAYQSIEYASYPSLPANPDGMNAGTRQACVQTASIEGLTAGGNDVRFAKSKGCCELISQRKGLW